MTEDHLKIGIAVENAGKDDADELDARLIMPSEAKGGQGEIDRCAEPRVIGVANARLRNLRMDQQRDAQLCGAGEGGLEDRMIEILVADAAVENGTFAA